MASVIVTQPRFGSIVVLSSSLSAYTVQYVPSAAGSAFTGFHVVCHYCGREVGSSSSNPATFDIARIASEVGGEHPGPFEITCGASAGKATVVAEAAVGPNGGGTATAEPAMRSGEEGSTVGPFVFTATPSPGFRFVKWTSGYSDTTYSTSQSFSTSVIVPGGSQGGYIRYVAHFEAIIFNISGSVSPDPAYGRIASGLGEYPKDTTVTLVAESNRPCFVRFKRWEDGSTGATRTFTVTGDRSVVAYFECISGSDILCGCSGEVLSKNREIMTHS